MGYYAGSEVTCKNFCR